MKLDRLRAHIAESKWVVPRFTFDVFDLRHLVEDIDAKLEEAYARGKAGLPLQKEDNL